MSTHTGLRGRIRDGDDLSGIFRRQIPDTVELCVRDKDRFPCLGVIHRLKPDGRIYCTRCGGTEPGLTYVRQAMP